MFYQPLDTIKFARNSGSIEKLPDDDARASKHVGALEWSNELSKSAFVGYLYIQGVT
jgi:hypothetical protein